VSPGTAARALGELKRRGIVITRERSHAYVSWRPPVGVPRFAPVPRDLRDLAYGNPDPKLLPDLRPALARLDPGQRLYGRELVSPPLAELAAGEFREVSIPAEHVTVTSGGLDAIERALAAHLQPGDLVAVEDPGFASLLHLVRAMGFGLRPVPVDERGLLPDELAQAFAEGARAAIAIPRGQNPTGACFDEQRGEEIRSLLRSAPDVLWIEDDHLGPLASAPRITAAGITERWFVTRSVSKSLGPDLRVGVVAGDAQTIDRVEGRVSVGPQWISHLLQELVADLWMDRAVQRKLAEASRTYDARREGFVAALREQGVETASPSGWNVWIPVEEETAVVQVLASLGWAVAPGAPFRMNTGPAIRVTVASLHEDDALALAQDVADARMPSRRATRA
jgi:DNA-binding transcriptional MocR family regulator